jgi:RimJ/RimL family protein N-acetyltransferase
MEQNQNIFALKLLEEQDVPQLVNYWMNAEHSFLEGMGVDISKLPTREEFSNMLLGQLRTPVEKKRSYCFIWLIDGKPSGHCNTNPSTFGEDAFMHLHLWNASSRKKGTGSALLKMTLPYFFKHLKLKKLISEPYALNPAPHKALEKAGFELVKEYITTPGSINFEQPVKRWEMTIEKKNSEKKIKTKRIIGSIWNHKSPVGYQSAHSS